METKAGELSIKSAAEGKVVATLARLGVPDRDGDVLKAGLLAGRQLVAIKPQHKWDHVNLGVADVYEQASTLEASLEFNLAIPSAKDWFEAIRFSHERQHRQQYSFGFEVVDSAPGSHDGKSVRFLNRIALAEVSPVLIGASIGSQTLTVKEQESQRMDPELVLPASVEVSEVKRLVTVHQTETDHKPWNFAIEHRQVKEAGSGAYYRGLFALQDPGREGQRKSYRFLHHRVNADGTPGPASVIACAQIIYALHKGLVPPDERKGVYEHLAAHLTDAGIEPPHLGDQESYVYPYTEEMKLFLWHADDVLQQTGNIHAVRAKRGLALTQAQLDQWAEADQKFAALRMLLSIKGLDKPYEAMLEQLSVEARGEVLAQRMERLDQKTQHASAEAERRIAEAFVARMTPKLS